MSPKNHLLTRDPISVWYIPSVPGADTGMYFITLLYLLHWLHFIHSCICYTFGAQYRALVTIVDYGDFGNLYSEIIVNFEINLNFKLNIEIYYGKGA